MASTHVDDLLAAAGTPVGGPSLSPDEAARALAEGRVLDVGVWSSMGDSEASVGPAASVGLDGAGRVHPRLLVFPRPIPTALRTWHREPWWESTADVYASFGVPWPPPAPEPAPEPAPPAAGGSGDASTADGRALVAVFSEVRAHLAGQRRFLYSGWNDASEAVAEIDAVLDALRGGRVPAGLGVYFLPTGPLQEASLDGGWGDAFLELARRFDRARGGR